jgi:dihydroorotase
LINGARLDRIEISRDRMEIATPDDFHVHLRDGIAMGAYARRQALSFGRCLVMPNTVPPIASGEALASYASRIRAASAPGAGGGLEPLMAFKLLPGMSAEVVRECAVAGAIAGKYYPAGSTTNAADGVSDPSEIEEALGAMEAAALVLSIHAEEPSAPVPEREAAFIPILEKIIARYPRLRIVVEHISTETLLGFVLGCPARVAGGLTAHHLLFSQEDVAGESLGPHLYCKPTIKGERDRDALREAVFKGEKKLFFGSDSAPHPRAAKECDHPASGVYSSPCAVAALAGLFDTEGRLGELEGFLSRRGAAFYGLPPPEGRLLLERRAWTVPAELDGVVPMLAGVRLAWSGLRAARGGRCESS